MLAGVGGPTVAAAKASMTMDEARVWSVYRKKRGSFNHSLRLELGFAQVLATLHSAFSGKSVNAEKFMPHVIAAAQTDNEPDPEKLFRMFQLLAEHNNSLSPNPTKRKKPRKRK